MSHASGWSTSYIHHCRRERFADACVDKRDRFWGGSVMVLGGIALGVKALVIVVEGSMTAVRFRDDRCFLK